MFDERLTVTGDRPDYEELLDLCEPPAWHADAACREHPGVSWFPGGRSPKAGAEAKAICGRCLAREDCLAWALEQGPELDGIWAGTTQRERNRLGREKRAA